MIVSISKKTLRLYIVLGCLLKDDNGRAYDINQVGQLFCRFETAIFVSRIILTYTDALVIYELIRAKLNIQLVLQVIKLFNMKLKIFFHQLSLIFLHNGFESCHVPYEQYAFSVVCSFKVCLNRIADLYKVYNSVNADNQIIIIQTQVCKYDRKCLKLNLMR